jgi:potassium/hydrogen antiporter
MVGDLRAPFKRDIERFHSSLATLAEIVVFVALGLTIDLGSLAHDHLWLKGIVLALVMALIARPLVGAVLLAPARLSRGEKVFVIWGGLKGAVPILLAALAVIAGADDARTIYEIVFVVVAFSVVVQGVSVPFAASRLGVPMRTVEPQPLDAP